MEMFLLQQLESFSLWRLSLQPADRQGVVLAAFRSAGRCRAVGVRGEATCILPGARAPGFKWKI